MDRPELIIVNNSNNVETREIRINLSTAKKWYKKGGELKDLALMAYTERELTFPNTWDEYLAKYKRDLKSKGRCPLDELLDDVYGILNRDGFLSKEQSQAHIALIKLHLLRDEYRNGWRIENSSSDVAPYSIFGERIYEWGTCDGSHGSYKTVYEVRLSARASQFLTFQDKETATEFLNNFRDLIEEAGDLV